MFLSPRFLVLLCVGFFGCALFAENAARPRWPLTLLTEVSGEEQLVEKPIVRLLSELLRVERSVLLVTSPLMRSAIHARLSVDPKRWIKKVVSPCMYLLVPRSLHPRFESYRSVAAQSGAYTDIELFSNLPLDHLPDVSDADFMREGYYRDSTAVHALLKDRYPVHACRDRFVLAGLSGEHAAFSHHMLDLFLSEHVCLTNAVYTAAHTPELRGEWDLFICAHNDAPPIAVAELKKTLLTNRDRAQASTVTKQLAVCAELERRNIALITGGCAGFEQDHLAALFDFCAQRLSVRSCVIFSCFASPLYFKDIPQTYPFDLYSCVLTTANCDAQRLLRESESTCTTLLNTFFDALACQPGAPNIADAYQALFRGGMIETLFSNGVVKKERQSNAWVPHHSPHQIERIDANRVRVNPTTTITGSLVSAFYAGDRQVTVLLETPNVQTLELKTTTCAILSCIPGTQAHHIHRIKTSNAHALFESFVSGHANIAETKAYRIDYIEGPDATMRDCIYIHHGDGLMVHPEVAGGFACGDHAFIWDEAGKTFLLDDRADSKIDTPVELSPIDARRIRAELTAEFEHTRSR